MIAFKFPKKLRLSLPAIFILLIAVVLLTELFVLYKYLYLGLAAKPGAVNAEIKSGVDSEAYQKMKSWVDEKKTYTLPNITLQGEKAGRENPFEDYK